MKPGHRYVLVGLASHRSAWFSDLAQWAHSGAIPAEFLKTASAEEARARLRTGRRCSAVVVGSSVVGWDRDAAAEARSKRCVVIVVEDHPAHAGEQHAGADGVLPAQFSQQELMQLLEKLAQPVARADEALDLSPGSAGRSSGAELALRSTGDDEHGAAAAWRGRLVAVTGTGGTGRSTLALALASRLAVDPRHHGLVALADLALRGHQALLHDAGDVVPGVVELVDAHRRRVLDPKAVRSFTFQARSGAYDLLLGLRRPRDWVALQPEALGVALDGMLSAYRLVVADTDAEVDGQDETGLVEIEERNQLARVTLGRADLVVVVGRPGLSGLRDLATVVADLVAFGVASDRVLAVMNRAARNPRRRAELSEVFHTVLGDLCPGAVLGANLLFIPERRGVEDDLADGRPPSAALGAALTSAVRVLLAREAPGSAEARSGWRPGDAVRVAPGSLGCWNDTAGHDMTGDGMSGGFPAL